MGSVVHKHREGECAQPTGESHRSLSLWMDSLSAGDLAARPALERDQEADITIVGAGFTGLWDAYYLAAADPMLRIAVLDKRVAGFGASGRNGRWCSALFAASGHRSPRWEPEPLRWLGINGARALMAGADASEERMGRPSRRARWMGRFVGH